MKRTEQRSSSVATAQPNAIANEKGNGHATTAEMTQAELGAILAGLQTMRDGDFSVRLPGVWTGVGGKIADTFNEIVIANQRMANELARVGQVVGKEGRTKERPRFYQPRGAWGEMEVSVNTLIDDLLRPTTEVTRAIAAVAQGNLAQTVRLDVDGRPLQGEFLRLANIVNTMIQQLSVFTAEVTRVAREVGTEGKLGGQAKVPGVAGTWKDLTDTVNLMASNLTGQVRNIAEVTTAVASGDLSRKITVDVRGEILRAERSHQHDGRSVALVRFRSYTRGARSRNRRKARRTGGGSRRGGNVERFDGLRKRDGRKPDGAGAQHRGSNHGRGRGDLSRKITVDVKGEILELKNTINTMVDQLNAFAAEVTRVAREVGTEGKLGGQAEVQGVGGTGRI